MRRNDLRWEHMAKLLAALNKGHSTQEAVTAAGIGPRVWRWMRSDWSQVGRHLSSVDRHGSPVDVWMIDVLIQERRTRGGRPKGKG